MRFVVKIALVLCALLLVVVAGGALYLTMGFPRVEASPDIDIEATRERIERGRYLANHVTVCIDCHSPRDWRYYSGPINPGTEGMGGDRFDQSMGIPGVLHASNITPTGIGDWTDGEIVRAITTGVKRNGSAMFPLMPYPSYARLSAEDTYSIVAYLRTLRPIENEVPESQLDFPMNFMVQTIPRDAAPQPNPDPSDTVAYGEYLTHIAGCVHCHTPIERGAPVPEMELAGGFVFELPWGTVRSANITPDMETGIGGWEKDFFIQHFRVWDVPESEWQQVEPDEFNTVMPWIMYAKMTDEDLGSIFDYLQTVEPITNQIEIFTPKND